MLKLKVTLIDRRDVYYYISNKFLLCENQIKNINLDENSIYLITTEHIKYENNEKNISIEKCYICYLKYNLDVIMILDRFNENFI